VDGLQRIFSTVDLNGDQWRACFIAVAGYFILAEVGKVVFRRVMKARSA
jgi:P-type Ca2+ transporter type 2C